MISKKNSFIFPLVIVIYTFFLWSGLLGLGFYNDDFQILQYLQKNYSNNPLQVFVSKDISSYYFRPIPNLWNASILNLFGFNPFFFRLSNLLLYTLLVISLYYFILKLLDDQKLALIATLLFSALPSHDIFLTWTASVGDLLASIFLILSFILIFFTTGRLGFFLSLLALILAFLSKESTFTAILLLFASGLLLKDKAKRIFLLAIVGSVSLAILLFYREIILGIHLFASPNIENFSLSSFLLNFFKYIPVVFIPTFAYSKENSLGLLLNFIFVAILLVFLTIWLKNKQNRNLKPIAFGVLWFALLLLPALPLFMRWYSLLPSLGLVFVLSELMRTVRKSFLYLSLLPFILILSVVDIYSVRLWNKSGAFCQKVLNETQKLDTKGKNKILLWFFPQYRTNFPVLRSGVEQAINFLRTEKFSEVLLPVSIVHQHTSNIELSETNSNKFIFVIQNAEPFLATRSEEISDSSIVENDYYRLSILKVANKSYKIEIVFIQTKHDYINFYFDGEKFRFLF